MATVAGFITISDIEDGVTGASIVSSNEAHTFVADADGAITATEAGMFTNSYTVYVGSTAYTYVNDTSDTDGVDPGTNQFSIASDATTDSQAPSGYRRVESITVSSGADINAYISSSGVIQVRDANTANVDGFFDANGPDSATISLTVVVDIDGVDTNYTKVLSFSKAKGGSAPYVRLSANTQAAFYSFGGSTPKSTGNPTNFVVSGDSFNDPAGVANWVWAYAVDGGSTFTTITASDATIAGAATSSSSISMTHAQFNTLLSTGNSITFRGTRGAQVDLITISKIEDASGGLNVIIEVTAGSTVFKNNPDYVSTDSSTYVDLRAVLQRGTETVAHDDITSYQWKKNGTNITLSVTQPAGSGENAYGATSRNIRLSADDINGMDEGGAELISCDVVIPDA